MGRPRVVGHVEVGYCRCAECRGRRGEKGYLGSREGVRAGRGESMEERVGMLEKRVGELEVENVGLMERVRGLVAAAMVDEVKRQALMLEVDWLRKAYYSGSKDAK